MWEKPLSQIQIRAIHVYTQYNSQARPFTHDSIISSDFFFVLVFIEASLSTWTIYSPNLPPTPYADILNNKDFLVLFQSDFFLSCEWLQDSTYSVQQFSVLGSFHSLSCFVLALSLHPPLFDFWPIWEWVIFTSTANCSTLDVSLKNLPEAFYNCQKNNALLF